LPNAEKMCPYSLGTSLTSFQSNSTSLSAG
jgi:hypothetical protein